MNDPYGRRRATLEPDDSLIREPLSPLPYSSRSSRSPRKTLTLAGLAALMVLTIVATVALVVYDPRAETGSIPGGRPSATATVVQGTPTPNPSDPKTYGWTKVGDGGYHDAKFAPSDDRRGYACGVDATGARTFGVTTDGGQTWQFGASPSGFDNCWLQVSPANPLDVVLNGLIEDCGSHCPGIDAHYSSDGGRTWQAAPIPRGGVTGLGGAAGPGGAAWAGSSLYVWDYASPDIGQQSFLQVSTNGGAFRSIPTNTLVAGAPDASVYNAVASGTTVYLMLTHSGGEASADPFQAIVASADGGQTWKQIPNQSSIQLASVVGTTFYGLARHPGEQPEWTLLKSSNTGATWTALSLPLLPDGQKWFPDVPGSWVAGPDGTIYVVTDAGVAYVRNGAWVPMNFPLSRTGDMLGAVTADANGHPSRVWLISAVSGIYWHALP